MHDFTWRHGIAAGLILIISFAIGGYILGFGLGEQAGEYQANSDTYAKHASDEINSTCARLNGAAQTKCIIDVIEATNQHERAESDLKAQRNMARWALLMLIATVLMTVVTAFGVYYVWRTLLATQSMAKDSKEIGKFQTKAYLRIKEFKFHWFGDGLVTLKSDDGIGFCVRPEFTNMGNSPARNILFACKFSLDSGGYTICKTKQSYFVIASPALGIGQTTKNLGFTPLYFKPKDFLEGATREVIRVKNHVTVNIDLSVVYEDVFGDKWLITSTYHKTLGVTDRREGAGIVEVLEPFDFRTNEQKIN